MPRNLNIDGKQVAFYELSDLSTVERLIPKYTIEYKKSTRNDVEQVSYINLPMSFDIETSTIQTKGGDNPEYIGFMYIWMFAIADIGIYGRTWEEFKQLKTWLVRTFKLHAMRRACIYAHNLGYEFQFMRNFLQVESVFARQKRKPIKVSADSSLEFRCSWRLSNMSLSKFIENTPGAQFFKRDGEKFDYRKIRYPDTPLSDLEMSYCYCDVVGLNEALAHLLKEDTIATIPITSTGFLRRECRAAVFENEENRILVEKKRLNPVQYVLCKTATRGGNCHANACYTNILLDDVYSMDIKSSYPAVMAVCKFPMSAFHNVSPTISNINSYANDYAQLIECTFYNILSKEVSTIPYIALAKCTSIYNPITDNGRVVRADRISMVCTDIDYNIICSHYYYDGEPEIHRLYVAKYGMLSYEFRKSLMEQFQRKCELESGDPYLYNKFKNKINAYFGMMLTDICSPEILFDNRTDLDPWGKGEIDIDAMLERYYSSKNSFLSYQDGLWVTAHARRRLQQGIDLTADDTVYCDTDSDKFLEESHIADFEKLNAEWKIECDKISDVPPYAIIDGKPIYLGMWDMDGHYSKFVTLGAKKYCVTYANDNYNKPKKRGKTEITVAGLSKESGSKYINEFGYEKFNIGCKVPAKYSGRLTAHYNDTNSAHRVNINGHEFLTGSNIALVPTTYEFGVSEDYYNYFTSVQ